MLNAAKSASIVMAFKSVGMHSQHYGPISANVLSYKVSGVTEYFQENNHVVVSQGKVVFMPKGSIFYTNIIEPGEYLEIKFLSSVAADPNLKIYSGFNSREMERAFRSAINYYAGKDDAAFFNCQIQLNRIFSIIASSDSSYLSSHERNMLAPALEYMKDHIYDANFSVKEMHKKIEISDTYFRQLFNKSFHMSPQRYIINERIQLAKSVLADTPTVSIQHIAELVGYPDVFYFSRVFKKETGESPSHFAKRMQIEHQGFNTN